MPKRQYRSARSVRQPTGDIVNRLQQLARNLWWTWNTDAQRLFQAVDPGEWRATNHNPIKTIASASHERRSQLEADAAFTANLADCEMQLARYLKTKTWFDQTAGRREKRLHVAYFCAEYAIHECMQMYAGGLGVLAGDHLKSASDLGIPLTAVGLIYRHGYYRQHLAPDGSTQIAYPEYDFRDWPVSDTGIVIDIPYMARTVKARIWRMLVGRVELFLLDTDIPHNRPRDRHITQFLYGGSGEYRIQQEIILGVGGRIALETLGIEPTVYHLNEGHAAFCTLQRLRRLTSLGASLDDAIDFVRETTVFTTHTPVPAGNDRFEPALAWKHLQPIGRDLGLSRRDLLAYGRENPDDPNEPFCMPVLALKLAEHCNGVAKLHGETSRKMWMRVYGANDPKHVPIRHVTNGIHVQTWLAPEATPIYRKYLRPTWVGAFPDEDWWANVKRIPPGELWALRNVLRAKLVTFIRSRLADQIARRSGPIDELIHAHRTFREDALTIGFARRFATYKRAPLIFRDKERLARIMGDPDRPVQLVFAGKAHPLDPQGKAFIQRIHRSAKSAGFRGRVVLIEDYDMHIGRILTAGCDVWLNNPIRPMEASGTSGMKPPLHGGINCSILDGWWPEGYNKRNGWAIGNGQPLHSRGAQDAHDAQCMYELLENDIIPRFFDRGPAGLPRRWITIMRASMRSIPAKFSSHRMVADYVQDYYLPAHMGE